MLHQLFSGQDGQVLQGVGSMLGGFAMLLTAVGAILVRTKITRAWNTFVEALMRPRLVLIERERREDAEARATSAERSSDNWESAAHALETRMDAATKELSDRIIALDRALSDARREIAQLKTRNDALIGYSQAILRYSVQLEQLALSSGLDLGALKMPPIPAILADRLSIPEHV